MISNHETISKNFEGKNIEFIEEEDDIWITAETIGLGLEYNNPRISIMRIYHRHKDELEEYSSVVKLTTEKGMRETTVFNEMGTYLLIMFSNQPRAKKFRKWVINVMKEIRKTGSHIEKARDPYDIMIKQAEMLKDAIIGLKEQNVKLNLLENHVISFEQKYEEERIITPQTKRIITDTVHFARKCTGRHWGTIYKLIWDSFQIRSITGISEILGQKIISWMKEHPFFKKYTIME